MKNLIFIITALLIGSAIFAQAPQSMKYQAVARDASGVVLANKNVAFKISILKGSATGTSVYSEQHKKTTNAFGLVDLEIGKGSSPTGTFSDINWGEGTYFVKVELDAAGGTSFVLMGTSQLLSVPYALYAKSSGNGFSGDYNELINKPVILNNTLQTTATGYQALQSNTGTSNTAGGYQALWKNTTGNANTATGVFALKENTTGWGNTATGSVSLMKNTTGYRNTAHGIAALNSNTTASDNTATGAYSLYSGSIGWANTASGARSLYTNTEGNYNIANGTEALYSNITGSGNTANGYQSLYSNTDGYENTAIGFQSGYLNQSGSGNTFIGSKAGYYETGSNKLFIDNQARANETDAREKALIYGVFDADPANQILTVNGNISAGNHFIKNLANPVNEQDAATKAYVDKLLKDLGQIPNNYAGTMKDIEENVYKTVQIGSQVWMAENLRAAKYKDGTAIPLVTDNTAWGNLTTPGYCWYNNDKAAYGNIYGALYNWYTVNTGKLCPTGWHVPSDAEWTTLTTFLGGESVAGIKMKETGTAHWGSQNTEATNESGFSGLPGGSRGLSGPFNWIGSFGEWWSSTEYSTTEAWYRYLKLSYADVYRSGGGKEGGSSIRCVRDN